ncbi:hypothetical protein [Streptomyces hesseae]|uniref:DUF4198 domain-containing protein n=1 Tax=Streptomyces hesseae TaxID=3075519 RepID=A0ABU2SPZ7_9ACTN|nr:hypothetical protein [Streptomyces sp. DSM 40473]MDT0451076.1 hypothetical protein [Streptomyces sp. DSM 40473]
MAFHIAQGSPNPQVLLPGANSSFTVEVYVDGDPVGPGEIIQVKLPEGLVFPPTGEIRYMKLDEGINRPMAIESRDPGGRLVRFKADAIGNKPDGFYSVNVQAAATAAPGDRTVPDGLTIGVTAAKLSFRIGAPQSVEHKVYGTVDANGNVLSGDGFVVRPGLTGTYMIAFTKAFVSRPTVLATLWKGGERGAISVESAETGLFTVRTATNGAWTPLGFSFMAMGPAAPKP